MLFDLMISLSPEAVASLRLADFVDSYVDVRRGEIKSHHAVMLMLRRMVAMLPDVPVTELRRVDIASYVQRRRHAGRSNGTINCELLTLSAAINYARRRWGWDLSNPVPGQYVRWPPGRLRYLDRSEALRLFAAAEGTSKRGAHVLPDFLQLAVNTGMRKNEILGLTWGRVRFETSMVLLTSDDTKNARPRALPLNTDALKAVRSREDFRKRNCKDSPWVFAERAGDRVKTVYPAFWEAVQRSGIENFRIHDLRHTFASWLVMQGVSLYVVRDLLGHSSIKMTERYAHLAQSALVEAVAVLNR